MVSSLASFGSDDGGGGGGGFVIVRLSEELWRNDSTLAADRASSPLRSLAPNSLPIRRSLLEDRPSGTWMVGMSFSMGDIIWKGSERFSTPTLTQRGGTES